MAECRSDNLLMIVARAPIAGATKTRLGAAIGMSRAAALHRAFLIDLANRFVPWNEMPAGYEFAWAITPATTDFAEIFADLAPSPAREEVAIIAQIGADLSERLTNLLRWGHLRGGHARTVILASDSPHLPDSVVTDAFAALSDRDVVIGRTYDGGYYLVGLRGFHDILTGLPMSTVTAADALVARALALDLRVAELPPTFDVDTAADLDLLIAALAPNGENAPVTWQALRDLDLIPAGAR